VLVLVAVPLAARGIDHYLPYYHFRTVEKGRFYRSSQLSGEDLAQVIDDYGIKTVINLRAASENAEDPRIAEEKRVAAAKGVRHVDVPCEAGHPPSPEQVEALLGVLDDAANRPVLVHCAHGTVRSAAAEGLWRREYMGESGEEAFDRVTTWGRDLERDYPSIAAFIREYLPRRDRAKATPSAPKG
jgi:uncharacterized protein (TIGR01244 family)